MKRRAPRQTSGRKQTVTYDRAASYRALLKKSVGTTLFQTAYARVNGRRRDVIGRGRLACAFYVSGILRLVGLIHEVHATVTGTVKDMARSGWRRTRHARPGDVIVWEPVRRSDGQLHPHLGFALGRGQALSNSSSRRSPRIHHWTYGTNRHGHPKRRVVAVYTHASLRAGR